jgi:colanic acid/amylovoran biosynthesis glycosyltransferase
MAQPMEQSGSKPANEESGVVLLFTTFPVLSETFLQREVRVLSRKDPSLRLVSLWGGKEQWEGLSVDRFGLKGILGALLRLPVWAVKRPDAFFGLLKMVWRPRGSGLLNWLENLLGAAYGIRHAGSLHASHLHGVWASAPAMAALSINRLTGIPYSFAGHAYDLFEHGGDGWLTSKSEGAQFIRTSTHAGRDRLLDMGVPAEKILLVRRGLEALPEIAHDRTGEGPYRILSVGRMVEKMGYARQIPVIRGLVDTGLELEVEWIGDGPERKRLEQAVKEAGLGEIIKFRGRLPYASVEEAYRRNDYFLFTGQVDRRGDRAGLPNAVAEAMAWGLVVFATDVGAVREAVQDGVTGCLWEGEPDATLVLDILPKGAQQGDMRRSARSWVEEHYCLENNLDPLCEHLSGVTFSA